MPVPKYNGNAAYDLELLDEQQQVKKKKNLRRAKPSQDSSPAISTFQALKIVAVSAVLLALVITMINGRVRLNEINSEISSMEASLQEEKSENIRLTMELNSLMSLENVEDYAVNVLGMQKIQNYQMEYVDTSEGNEFEFFDEESRQTQIYDVNESLKELFGVVEANTTE